VHPNLDIVVISDSPIYPPLQFQVNASSSLQHLHVVSLNVNLNSSVEERNPLSFIKTNLVLFVPDSVRLPSSKFLQQLLSAVDEIDPRALVIPSEGSADSIVCLRQDFNVKEWTVHLTKEPGGALCDAVQGKHAILITAAALRSLPEPFMRPFPEALFLQASARGVKVNSFFLYFY
jgi:fukutin-related protein